MSRAAIVISLVATFIVGAALGLVGGILFQHRVLMAMRGERPGFFLFHRGGPGFGDRGMGPRERPSARDALPRLQRLLDLTPEQVKRIEPKVVESQRLFEAARESLHARIDVELTPQQRERWQAFQRSHPFPGPPPGADDRTHRAPPGDEGAPR